MHRHLILYHLIKEKEQQRESPNSHAKCCLSFELELANVSVWQSGIDKYQNTNTVYYLLHPGSLEQQEVQARASKERVNPATEKWEKVLW